MIKPSGSSETYRALTAFLAMVALCLLAVAGLPAWAQIPDVYMGNLDGDQSGPAWRSLDDLLSSRDEVASEAIDHLEDMLAMRSGDGCQSYTLPGRSEKPAVSLSAALQGALKRSKHSGLATVLSSKAGLGPGGGFGTLLELEIVENFKAPFKKSARSRSLEKGDDASRIYYFYPGWEYSYKGVRLCLHDSLVPSSIPAPGGQIVVFTAHYDDSAPPYFFSSSLLPVIFDSRNETRTNLLGAGAAGATFGDVVAELRGLAQ